MRDRSRTGRRLLTAAVLGALGATAVAGPSAVAATTAERAPTLTTATTMTTATSTTMTTATSSPRRRPATVAAVRGSAALVSVDVRQDLQWLLAHPTRGATDGLWRGNGGTCVRCAGGLATAAATLAAVQRDPRMLKVAETAFDRLIRAHYRASDGTIRPAMGQEGGPDIQTALFAGELGQAVLELGNRLDAGRRVRYTKVVTSAVDFLVRNGNLRWYTNGNIVLANAAAAAAAYRLTGKPVYRADYETAWAFALRPPQKRWPGYGLVVTRPPHRADGADGRAYLTEAGVRGPGYDPEYTELQLSTLTRLYLINHDPRVLRLMNMEMNQLLPRIRRSDWMLDTSGGTRHPEARREQVFRSGAVAVLAASGRSAFAPWVRSQAAATLASMRSERLYANPGTQYGYGIDLVADLEAPSLL